MQELIEDHFVSGLLTASYELKFFDFESQVFQDYLLSTSVFLEEHRVMFRFLLVDHPTTSFIEKYKISIKYHYYEYLQGDEFLLEMFLMHLLISR